MYLLPAPGSAVASAGDSMRVLGTACLPQREYHHGGSRVRKHQGERGRDPNAYFLYFLTRAYCGFETASDSHCSDASGA